MIKVGITGSQGFVGYHLYQSINLLKEEFKIVDFERSFFKMKKMIICTFYVKDESVSKKIKIFIIS